MSNEITAYFKGRIGVAESVYQYDYGLVLDLDSAELPASFDCYFSNSGDSEAVPAVGADNRVAIPNKCLTMPGVITAHIPLHSGLNDSETEYVVSFKVLGRAKPVDDGTEADQTAISQAIAALNHNNLPGLIPDIVTEWLEDHPEATTTVMDGAITKAKLHSTLKVTADMFIHNETEFAEAINDPQYKTYYLGDFDINAPIDINDNRAASELTFVGGHLTLNAALFTNSSIEIGVGSSSWAIPNFVGTYFERGEYDTLFDLGFYTLWGHFTSCHFINVSFVRASIVVQSPRFENCFFIADENTPSFINANAVYDAKFSNCDWEASYVPILINVAQDTAWGSGGGSTMRQVSFVNCISEGRAASLVRFNNGDIEFYGHYAEGNTAPIVDVYKAESQAYQFHSISFINSFLNTASENQHIVLIEEDYNYENTSFLCIGCVINGCKLVNTNKFLHYVVENNQLVGNTTVYPAKVMSKIATAMDCGSTLGRCYTNGIAFFKQNTRKIYIRPELTLLTFMSPYGGAYTTFVLIAGARSSSEIPSGFLYCLSHPSLEFSITYNDTIGMLEITIPDSISAFSYAYNMSATKLCNLFSDSTGIDYYRSKLRNGHTPLEVGEIFES